MILVTGGAKGLGAEICLHLAKNGHDILIHYLSSKREADELELHCKKIGVRTASIQGDFSDASSLETFLSSLERQNFPVKGIVNNVGNYVDRSSVETMTKEWMALLQTNLLAPIGITNSLLQQICRNEGSIVNIGVSGISPPRAKVKVPAYMVTKMGLWSYTLSLAKELAPKNVNVNMVSPGFIEGSLDLPSLEQMPMKRYAKKAEIAKIVALLFEKDGHYITGQNIEIAGGFGL